MRKQSLWPWIYINDSYASPTLCHQRCEKILPLEHFAPTSVKLMDILPQLFFAYYFGISLAYLGHILGMSWPYHIDMPMIWPKYAQWAHLGHILGISRPSLGNILDLSWECLGHVSEYLGHILGIFLPSLGNVSDISWACLLDRHNICQKIYTARFSG